MKIIDSHCDALLKLWEDPINRPFNNDPAIQVNYERMQEGEVSVQCFALFAEPFLKNDEKYKAILKQAELFHNKVLREQQLKLIREWKDLTHLTTDQIGAILTLEGMDCIGDDLDRLRLLYELGVKSVGITWNEANLCADGVGEARGAGLTTLGKAVVKLNNERRVLTDVSHISEQGFWDCMEVGKFVWASHSNAKALCHHPRNLNDEQIKAIINKGGLIGIVFYPLFLTKSHVATLEDIVKHIEHICNLGGAENICFGSDFDGIPVSVRDLEHAGHYQNLINKLMNHYDRKTVEGFAHHNFLTKIGEYFN